MQSLSEYFVGVAAKRPSAVEASPERSNQHEFNGVADLKKLFGTGKKVFSSTFLYLGDDDEALVDSGFVTWYDARERHPSRSEHRLYFPTTSVSERMEEGDLVVFGLTPKDEVIVIVCRRYSSSEARLRWLFGLKSDVPGFEISLSADFDRSVDLAATIILDELGLQITPKESDLELVLDAFGEEFPTTRRLSTLARTVSAYEVSAGCADEALVGWLEREESLFRALENHVVGKRIETGFDDVDDFVSFSLSVQNRRKSRAGLALENHMEQVFLDHGVSYSRNKKTEIRSKPDFIFPSITHYHDAGFPVNRLTMLGTKSSCKERWRQVLVEADRIDEKHLLTLEPSMSENQMEEMKTHSLQLVIPRPIQETYQEAYAAWLWSVDDFLNVVSRRQHGT